MECIHTQNGPQIVVSPERFGYSCPSRNPLPDVSPFPLADEVSIAWSQKAEPSPYQLGYSALSKAIQSLIDGVLMYFLSLPEMATLPLASLGWIISHQWTPLLPWPALASVCPWWFRGCMDSGQSAYLYLFTPAALRQGQMEMRPVSVPVAFKTYWNCRWALRR